MYTNVPIFSRQSHRVNHQRLHVIPTSQSFHEYIPLVHERVCTIKLRRRRAQAARSFYDNTEEDENEPVVSKWTIVRQRLPDILALSRTYRPTSVRAQLVLLIALMSKQSNQLLTKSHQPNINQFNNTISHIVPTNVIIDVNGNSRLVSLKHIPPEQVIHVDIDNLSFSIPTRQFILALSRDFANETATRYCPPAISDMLVDLSNIKLADDRLKYKRAQFKMRLGQITFLFIFIFIITMMFILITGAAKSVFKVDPCNQTDLCMGDHGNSTG